MRLVDGSASTLATLRCDNDADDTIISPKIEEQAAIKGIGKMRIIKPIVLQVAMTKVGGPQTFKMSGGLNRPRVILHVAARKHALMNVTLLVTDGNLAGGDLIIGLAVMRHLKADIRTMLEQNRKSLNRTDCFTMQNTVREGGQSLIVRLTKVPPTYDYKQVGNENPSLLMVNFFEPLSIHEEFPIPNPMDSREDNVEKIKIRTALEEQF